jgi:hypothetical protein
LMRRNLQIVHLISDPKSPARSGLGFFNVILGLGVVSALAMSRIEISDRFHATA